tara:strand:- start:116 stop:475 length:360 start_codon:yes stop_codon:yes gene_type:complete
MIQNSILIYKNWTCSFCATEYSLKYSDVEIVDSIDGHQELLKALLLYICKKHKSKCKYFRITDDIKNVTIVVAKKEINNFLNYLKEISSGIEKYQNPEMNYKYRSKINNEGILKDISIN